MTQAAADGEAGGPGVREAAREGVTMALYVGLSLLAVVLATGGAGERESGWQRALQVFLTAIGLLVAHVLAFSVSTRLVTHGQIDAESRRTMSAQVVGGGVVAVVAALPVLLLPDPWGVEVAQLLLVALVTGVAYTAARQAEAGRGRALLYAAAVVVATGLVLLVKGLAGH